MKKIFNIPTLFVLSGLIALFLMPGDMLNAKTRAQLIKEATAALAKARRMYREQEKKLSPFEIRKNKAEKQYTRAKKELDLAKPAFMKEFNILKDRYYAIQAAKAALARAQKPPVKPVKPVKTGKPVVQPAAGTWKKLPGAGLDIGVGSKGNAWVVGLDHVPYYWDGRAWRKTNGGLDRCDVDPLGRIWGVNKVNDIWLREKNGAWHKLPGKAIDIGCGGPGNGVTWCVGVGKNYAYRWNGKTWQLLSGPDVRRIDVDNRGYAWVVNKHNGIFAFDGKRFWQKPGRGIDISCGPDGSVWLLGMDKTVYKWNGRGWTKGNGMGYHITVDNRGLPWVIGMDKATWMRTK
ncbi:tectonin domain-containing protein [Candidatus Riflebacteria bacterium]